jgi:hypothetical protein
MLIVVAAAFTMAVAPIMAQQPNAQQPNAQQPTAQQPNAPPQQAPQASTASGKLVRVDAKAKTIAIRTAANAEMLFSYTDATKVTGAEETVAGLATMSGTDVTVHYTKKGQENIASQIEVKKPAA